MVGTLNMPATRTPKRTLKYICFIFAPVMRATPTLHFYSKAVPVSGGTYTTCHFVFNDEGEPLELNKTTRDSLSDRQEAGGIALRAGVESLYQNHTPDTLVIHTLDLINPQLELGRLPHDIRTRLNDTEVIITGLQQANCQKLLYALAEQPIDVEWYTASGTPSVTTPLTVYLDGSYRDDSIDDDLDQSATLGCVIVDATGRVIWLTSQRLVSGIDSLHAEYSALKTAIDAVKRIQPNAEVTFKTDNNNIEHTFGFDNEAPPRLAPLAERIRAEFTSFNEVSISKTTRDKNTIADALADIGHRQQLSYTPDTRGRPATALPSNGQLP